MNTINKFLLCKRCSFEELLHKFLISFSNSLTDSLNKTIKSVVHLICNVTLRHRCFNGITVSVILVCLHLDKIDIACNLTVLDNRYHNRTYSRTENSLEFCECVIEICIWIIKLCNDKNFRLSKFFCKAVGFSCTDLNT